MGGINACACIGRAHFRLVGSGTKWSEILDTVAHTASPVAGFGVMGNGYRIPGDG